MTELRHSRCFTRKTWQEARERRQAEVERLRKELAEMEELLAIAEEALADPLVRDE